MAAWRVRVVDSMMRLTVREQERVWELRAEGHSSRAIGRELGLRQQYVSLCVASTGGVRPPVRKRSRRCLTETEREEISRGVVPPWCVAIRASRRREYPGGEFFVPCVLVIKRLGEGERHDKAQLNQVLRDHGAST